MRKYLDIIAVNMAVVGLGLIWFFAVLGGTVFANVGLSGFGPVIRSDATRGLLLIAGAVYIAAVALLSAWEIITEKTRGDR